MEKYKKLIQLYETLIFGDDDNHGLLDCYDAYYMSQQQIWDDLLDKIKQLNKPQRAKKKKL